MNQRQLRVGSRSSFAEDPCLDIDVNCGSKSQYFSKHFPLVENRDAHLIFTGSTLSLDTFRRQSMLEDMGIRTANGRISHVCCIKIRRNKLDFVSDEAETRSTTNN